jgi:hypothetical protein
MRNQRFDWKVLQKQTTGVFIFQKVVFEKLFLKLSYVCFLLKKLINGKHFSDKEKFDLIFRKVFFFYFNGKHFSEIVKDLKISYYLLIISNLVLKLLIVIYFV